MKRDPPRHRASWGLPHSQAPRRHLDPLQGLPLRSPLRPLRVHPPR